MSVFPRLTIPVILLWVTFPACDSKPSGNCNPTGNWDCRISTQNINGNEYINLYPDSTLAITDSVCYSASDKRWNMSVRAKVKTSGQWYTTRDSLILILDKIDISTDASSFSIHTSDTESSPQSLDEFKSMMSQDFCAAVYDELSALYYIGNRKQINLGKIEYITQDSMSVRNGSNSIFLTRVASFQDGSVSEKSDPCFFD